jgi:hypothetical protein
MLVTAILFDEIQHSKPGKGCRLLLIRAWSKPMDPAQLGISELIHQKNSPTAHRG